MIKRLLLFISTKPRQKSAHDVFSLVYVYCFIDLLRVYLDPRPYTITFHTLARYSLFVLKAPHQTTNQLNPLHFTYVISHCWFGWQEGHAACRDVTPAINKGYSLGIRPNLDIEGHRNFSSIVSLFSAWNITTVEIISGIYLLKS